jgi:DNA primase
VLVSPDTIAEVKTRHDIAAFIGSSGVELKRQGRFFVGRCPFHSPDKTPSLVVDPSAQLFNCLGACRTKPNAGGGKGSSGGDVIAFAMKLWGVDFREALKRLGADVPKDLPLPRTRAMKRNGTVADTSGALALSDLTSRAPRIEARLRSVEVDEKELSINVRAQEFLESRALVTKQIWRAFHVGYASGALEELCQSEESLARKLFVEMGRLTKDGKDRMKSRVVFPLYAFNQLPVALYGRAIDEGVVPRHMLEPGPRRGLVNQNAGKRSREILLVESALCVLSLAEAGVTNAVALLGSSVVTEDHRELVRRSGVTSVVVALDGDETGRKAAPQIAAAFAELGVSVRAIEWPEKDPNAILVEHGPRKLREIVDRLLAPALARDVAHVPAEIAAEHVGARELAVDAAVNPPLLTAPCLSCVKPARESTEEVSAVREEVADVSSVAKLSAQDLAGDVAASDPSIENAQSVENIGVAETTASTEAALDEAELVSRERLAAPSLTLTRGERLFVIDWLDGPSPAHLRATVKLFVGEAPQAPAHLDSFNLLSSRSRETYARRAASLALPPDAASSDTARLVRLLEGDLLKIAELGTARREAAEKAPATSPSSIGEERRRSALTYLRSPDLLSRLALDIGASGYVGETTVKVLGYLVSISRKLSDALSMVILSSSGSGKSALAEVLEKLTPEEDLLVVTRFTASSLYWMGKDALKRKFVSIEERVGSQEADYSIRALQSKKKVTMMTPIKDQATGKIETKLFEVEGPASFLESTTESQIHHENATRCFEVRLDESREQTRRIQEAQRHAKTREGQRQRLLASEIEALHQDVQRLLRPIRVVIPFADEIEFPSESIRMRRDNPRFLNLIEALAFLHQYQRPLQLFSTGERSERPLETLSDEELLGYRIEATLEDYASAYELASDLLYETLAELKRPLRVFFGAIRELAKEAGETASFLGRQLRDRTSLPHHTIKRYLAELVELEYLAVTRGVRGATNAYRLVDLPEKEGGRIPGLLLPAELAAKLSGAEEARPS